VRTVGRKWHEREYNALLKEHTLPADRVALWERCERDSWKPVRTGAYDWKIAIVALKQELTQYKEKSRPENSPTE
jgi:hypothetical protein